MPELPPVVAKLWGHEVAARKGPRPRLDLDTITAAAIELADAGGLAAVSMSSVAKRVNVATMALYRYVGSKDELLTLMAEAALPPPPQRARARAGAGAEAGSGAGTAAAGEGAAAADGPAATDGAGAGSVQSWRADLATWTRANRDALLARPWLLSLPGAVPPIGPRRLAWLEAALAALGETPLDDGEQFRAATALSGYALSDAMLTHSVGTGSLAGVEGAAGYGELLAEVLDPASYPVLSATVRSGLLRDSEGWVEDMDFTFGLDLLLDGLEALIERRSTQG